MAEIAFDPTGQASATVIQRRYGSIAGLREARDESSTLCVMAFPFTAVPAVSAELAVAGVYLLTGGTVVYLGESGNVGRRLAEHRDDPSKAFAVTAYVVTGAGQRLDKPSVQYLQFKLTAAAEAAGLFHVQRGAAPCRADLPVWRALSLDRMISDLLRLAFDLGCRAFHTTEPPAMSGAAESAATAGDADDESDAGQMEIGVSTTPAGTQEFELLYGDLWTRGYQHQDRFIVAAGSEIRLPFNPSVIAKIRRRREQLLESAVTPIPGTPERMRLAVAVAFPSMAIAGKVMAGAHLGSDRWRPIQGAPVVFT